MESFETVFEFSFQFLAINRLPVFVFMGIGFIILGFGIFLFYYHKKNKTEYISISKKVIYFGGIIIIPFLSLFIFSLKMDYNLYRIYKSGKADIVEGRVKVLYKQPYDGHAPGDSIEIIKKKFEINYFGGSNTYEQTISHGGVLRDGVLARVYYYKNIILRVDIAKNQQYHITRASTVTGR